VRLPSVRLPSVRLPSVRLPSVRLPSVRLPSLAPVGVALATVAASMRALIDSIERGAAAGFRSASLAITTALPSFAASVSDLWRSVGRAIELRAANVRAGVLTMTLRMAVPSARVVRSRRRSPAPLLAALALLAAFVGGTLVFAGGRPPAAAPAPIATATPQAAVLASTSSPVVTEAPTSTPEPTAEPTPEPTAAPTLAPTPAPAAVAVTGDPAGTIVSFYQLVSGRDYASASGLWSDRMRAAYPPQTNIWGRFDATSSIIARSAWVTSATSGSAAVAVDLVETLRNGSARRWVGTWYLVRSGSGWLLDQPGLRPG
jgi:hypothetical protein